MGGSLNSFRRNRQRDPRQRSPVTDLAGTDAHLSFSLTETSKTSTIRTVSLLGYGMRIPAIVYVLALGAFALITTELGVIGILPQVSEGFGITIDRAGWLLSGFALVIALLGPWMTLLFSKVNRKLSLCFVLFIFFLSNSASLFAPNFNILLLTRIIPAFVHPVFWSVAMSVAAASVDPKRSSRAVSIVFTGFSAGIVLGVPIASFAAGSDGWQAGFIVFSALNAVALVAHLILLPSMPVTHRLSFGSQLGSSANLYCGGIWFCKLCSQRPSSRPMPIWPNI
ncbi:MAG: transporter [Rhodospirillales bacterium]|nr:transporter [Rhodospirillales bacterium]